MNTGLRVMVFQKYLQNCGADFRLKCMGCGHQIMIARKIVEKNTKDLKKKACN